MSQIDNISTMELASYYEILRTSKRLKDVVDFPSANSFKYNTKKRGECIIITQQNIKNEYDWNNKLSTLLFKYQEMMNIIDTNEFQINLSGEDSEFRLCIIWMLIILIKLYFLRPEESHIKTFKDFDKLILDSKEKEHKVFWRGQTNAKYYLVPSIFRNLSKDEDFNFYKILDKYDENEDFLNEYDNLFGMGVKDPSSIKEVVDFFAYMQHSICYSRLLDLTDKP